MTTIGQYLLTGTKQLSIAGIATARLDTFVLMEDQLHKDRAFLLAHPEHRLMARRVQQSARSPYAEIQDNLLAADMLPIDILRCKLAFFGASHFDLRSDKWVRISLYKGEPFPDDLGTRQASVN